MNWLQQPWLETLGWTLLHSVWQLSAIAAIAFLALLVVRRHSSHLRYVIAYAVLLLMVATTLGTYAYLWSHRPYPIALSTSASITPPAVILPRITIESLPPTILMSDPTLRDRALSALHLIAPYAALLYLVGGAFVAVRLFAGYAALRRLRASAFATPDHQALLEQLRQRLRITKPVQLLHSPHVEVPAVLGAWRPLILLPLTTATGLSTDHLTCLLLHELAHIRRHDYLANLVQSVIETLLFYHPAVIWLSAHIRQEREHCCDDIAIANSNRAQYATALVSMESLRAAPILALGASGGSLLQRIRRILNAPTPRSARDGVMGAASVVTAALFIACFALYLAACSPDLDQPSTAPTSTNPAMRSTAPEGSAVAATDQRPQILLESRIMFVHDDVLAPIMPPPEGETKTVALTEEELKTLMENVKRDSTSVSISAPRVAMFDGQLAEFNISRQANPKQSNSDDVKRNAGVEIKVRATIAEDRHSILLKINPDIVRGSGSQENPPSPDQSRAQIVSVPNEGTVLQIGQSVEGSDPTKPDKKRSIVLLRPRIIDPKELSQPTSSPTTTP